MKIEKIINNNVVSAFDEEEKELVIMGRGIAFQKKVGDVIDEGKIEKIFKLESKGLAEKFKQVLNEISLGCMEVSEEIIQHAKMNLGRKLNEAIYISLTDHIHHAIERHKKGMSIKSGLLWETKRIYKDEFQIGKEALKIIDKRLGVALPEDEAAFIALHFVNAQLNEELPTVAKMTRMIQEILNIVRYHFKVDFDEESLYYYRFVTHLKFFAQRLFDNSSLSNEDNSLYETVKNKYVEAYQCTEKIKVYLGKEYSYLLSNEEMIYLIIHIERLTKKVIYKLKTY